MTESVALPKQSCKMSQSKLTVLEAQHGMQLSRLLQHFSRGKNEHFQKPYIHRAFEAHFSPITSGPKVEGMQEADFCAAKRLYPSWSLPRAHL